MRIGGDRDTETRSQRDTAAYTEAERQTIVPLTPVFSSLRVCIVTVPVVPTVTATRAARRVDSSENLFAFSVHSAQSTSSPDWVLSVSLLSLFLISL